MAGIPPSLDSRTKHYLWRYWGPTRTLGHVVGPLENLAKGVTLASGSSSSLSLRRGRQIFASMIDTNLSSTNVVGWPTLMSRYEHRMIGRPFFLVFCAALAACAYTKPEIARQSYCLLRQQALEGDHGANANIKFGLETRGRHGERWEIAWALEPSIADREYTYLLKSLVARDITYRSWLADALYQNYGRWPPLVDHSWCIERAATYLEVDACMSDQVWWDAVDITKDLPCPMSDVPAKP